MSVFNSEINKLLNNKEVVNLISLIEKQKAQLNLLRTDLSPKLVEKILKNIRLEVNYNSNNIEGNSLTMQETRQLLLFDLYDASNKKQRDLKEMKGHNEAILYLENFIYDDKLLSKSLLRDLNKLILVENYTKPAITPAGNTVYREIHAGQFKSQPNHVITESGQKFMFAEPFEVDHKLDGLLEWLNESLYNNLNPLIVISVFHYYFIVIHPFDDGNGRVCRLLVNILLQKKHLWPIIIKSAQKEVYYDNLRRADQGDLIPFTLFLGYEILNTLELVVGMIKSQGKTLDDVYSDIKNWNTERIIQSQKIVDLKYNINNLKSKKNKHYDGKEGKYFYPLVDKFLKTNIISIYEMIQNIFATINSQFKNSSTYRIDETLTILDTINGNENKFSYFDGLINTTATNSRVVIVFFSLESHLVYKNSIFCKYKVTFNFDQVIIDISVYNGYKKLLYFKNGLSDYQVKQTIITHRSINNLGTPEFNTKFTIDYDKKLAQNEFFELTQNIFINIKSIIDKEEKIRTGSNLNN